MLLTDKYNIITFILKGNRVHFKFERNYIYVDNELNKMFLFDSKLRDEYICSLERESGLELGINIPKMIDVKPLQSEELDIENIKHLLKSRYITKDIYNKLLSHIRKLKIKNVLLRNEE